jgi:hypothetical protein
MQILCLPVEHPFRQSLIDLAGKAATRLELERHLARLVFCLDDIAPDERVWLGFGSIESTRQTSQRTLDIYLHPDHLCRDRPSVVSLLPGPRVWESKPVKPDSPTTPDDRLFRPKVERFLYHQLLATRDLCQGLLDPTAIPDDLAEAAQELWAVTVDGRLRQSRLPGYSAAERRQRFSRVFARGGVLLPVHWDMFHQLWEGADLDQAQLLKLSRHLPGLRHWG